MTEELEPEDLLSESLVTIFEDVPVSHGEPGGHLTHKTQNYGDIKLKLVKTDTDTELHKFAHHLWVSELELAAQMDAGLVAIKGLRVLELGAGAGLCGIIAVKAGAKHVTLSDYPGAKILANLRENVSSNLLTREQDAACVVGHIWGDSVEPLLAQKGTFDVILLADCLWLPEQHANLAQTLANTLSRSSESKIHCIAGFHTGRKKLSGFFDYIADVGLEVKEIYEQNYKGERRDWDPVRPDCEDPVQRKRYIVCAILGFPQTPAK
ncbi:putative methyltransferase-domain-containing protein [Protomyces lactucae-debilis]|uniref:Putative methyltransferase-domain-containing protein n=1 Tax=Protomyces lactucae-debilis TaxID=2754530 RepID=A0A1Y2FDW5_PROLT|nr:putative methyltransferase-domain-containing protein [Protomyces lactucae-debilis]ORY82118.1 putative methyltransferase-domain-containing protein [Protomyces lactucae-debilis]